MATTDAQLASAAVDALTGAGVRMAFLHKEHEAARGEIRSDLDILVDRGPTEVLRAACPGWAAMGLFPVLATEYDVGCTTIWLSTSDAAAGIQLDLTYDRAGRNRFGASTAWLEDVVPGVRWPVVSPARQREYRIRKSEQKALGRRVRPIDLPRAARRLREPAGYWVHLRQPARDAGIDRAVRRFGGFLPGVTCTAWVPGALGCCVRTAAARWRPRLVLTFSAGPNRVADLDLRDPDGLCEHIVAALHERFTSRFGLRQPR